MRKMILFLFLSFFWIGYFSAGFAQAAGEVSKDAPVSVPVKDAPATVIPPTAEVWETKDTKTDAAPGAVIPPTAEVRENKDGKTEPDPSGPDSKTESPANLSPGLYHYEENGVEFAEEEDGISGTGTQKMQMDLKADGTFTITIYATVPETGMEDQIIRNFRGTWKQDGEKLIQSGILARYFNFESNSFSLWESPDDGETEVVLKIRNITPGTFQEYDEASDSWITWIRL